MPVISVTLLPGYPQEAQHRLAHTARSVIDASDAGTTVFVQEVSAYRRDGKVFASGGPVLPDASQCVSEFLVHGRARFRGCSGIFSTEFRNGFSGW